MNESKNLTEFKRKVRERDNYTCQVCEAPGKIVHHLRSYANHPWLRLDMDNVVTLCNNCHNEYHTLFGYDDSYPDQFYKFRDMKNPI